jgi:hypothetical protein
MENAWLAWRNVHPAPAQLVAQHAKVATLCSKMPVFLHVQTDIIVEMDNVRAATKLASYVVMGLLTIARTATMDFCC